MTKLYLLVNITFKKKRGKKKRNSKNSAFEKGAISILYNRFPFFCDQSREKLFLFHAFFVMSACGFKKELHKRTAVRLISFIPLASGFKLNIFFT